MYDYGNFKLPIFRNIKRQRNMYVEGFEIFSHLSLWTY